MTPEEKRVTVDGMKEFYHAEHIYKELYIACPGAFETPISGWAEFKARLIDGGYDGTLPDDAPSPIMPWLSEKIFFRDNFDVAIVKNDRYCPPFLHKLEFIKIVYVVCGSALLFTGGKRFFIGEGEMCIVPPGIENAAFSCDDGDAVINVIVKRSTFETSFASLLMETSTLSDYLWRMLYKKNGGDVLFFRKTSGADLTDNVLEIYHELALGGAASNIMLKSYIMLFFGQMLRYYEIDRDVDLPGNEKPSRIAEVITYMNEHKRDVTLAALAEHFHFSEGYMSRVIRRETGSTFRELLCEMRVEQAAVMLRNSAASVEEICLSVGYTDESRFYRTFKAHFGVTPAQFRRAGL